MPESNIMAISDFIIDPEFQSRIPPLTKEEFEQLEANILSAGQLHNPILVWNSTIVDGHNRYKVLSHHPEISYTIQSIDFTSKDEAITWICKNQLGRRNLTQKQKRYLVGRQYGNQKKSHGGERGVVHGSDGKFASSSQNGNLRSDAKTCERIAQETNTSKNYVIRAESFADGIDAANEIIPGIREQVLSGHLKPTDKAVIAVAQAPPAERETSVAKMLASCDRRRDREKNDPPSYRDKMVSMIEEISSRDEDDAKEDELLTELGDALSSMILRWNWSIRQNAILLKDSEVHQNVQNTIDEAISYLNELKERIKNEVY